MRASLYVYNTKASEETHSEVCCLGSVCLSVTVGEKWIGSLYLCMSLCMSVYVFACVRACVRACLCEREK